MLKQLLGYAVTALVLAAIFFGLGIAYQRRLNGNLTQSDSYQQGFAAGYEARKQEVKKKLLEGTEQATLEASFGETQNKDGTVNLLGKVVGFEDQKLRVEIDGGQQRVLFVDGQTQISTLDQFDATAEPQSTEDMSVLAVGKTVSLVYQPQGDGLDVVLSVIVYSG